MQCTSVGGLNMQPFSPRADSRVSIGWLEAIVRVWVVGGKRLNCPLARCSRWVGGIKFILGDVDAAADARE